MAQLTGYQYNPNDAKENNYEALPAGDYNCIIVDSELADAKKPGNKYLKLTWRVIDGPKKDRQFFEILNIINSNQQAKEISQRALNSICLNAGFNQTPQDSAQLHGIPMIVKLGITGSEDDEYGIQNRVKQHLPLGGGQTQPTAPVQPPVQQQGQAPVQQPVQQQTASAPWVK